MSEEQIVALSRQRRICPINIKGMRNYSISRHNKTFQLIKRFRLWMDKRTRAKRIKQDWDRYFRGQIEIMGTSDVRSYVKPNPIYFELKPQKH